MIGQSFIQPVKTVISDNNNRPEWNSEQIKCGTRVQVIDWKALNSGSKRIIYTQINNAREQLIEIWINTEWQNTGRCEFQQKYDQPVQINS